MIKLVSESGLCDYFAMDIKNDIENYAKIIGYDIYDTSNIQKSVEYFLSGKADYEFRTTLIKQFHKKDNIINIAKWIKGANKYFLQKFKLGDNCIDADNLSPVDDKMVIEFKDILKNYIPIVQTRGYDL